MTPERLHSANAANERISALEKSISILEELSKEMSEGKNLGFKVSIGDMELEIPLQYLALDPLTFIEECKRYMIIDKQSTEDLFSRL